MQPFWPEAMLISRQIDYVVSDVEASLVEPRRELPRKRMM